ncbi:hypothetical protein JHK85_054071 [Glycine max]|nr:hypothetical protein JHK85_054071 [Glycine max]
MTSTIVHLLWKQHLHISGELINDVIQSYAQVMPSPVPIVKPLLVQVEFSDVAKLRKVKIDDVLVTILVERWRPESYAFHLFVGECTITLEDVTLQLGSEVVMRIKLREPTKKEREKRSKKFGCRIRLIQDPWTHVVNYENETPVVVGVNEQAICTR